MQKRIFILEAEKSTQEALKCVSFSSLEGLSATAVPESNLVAATNKDVTKEKTALGSLKLLVGSSVENVMNRGIT